MRSRKQYFNYVYFNQMLSLSDNSVQNEPVLAEEHFLLCLHLHLNQAYKKESPVSSGVLQNRRKPRGTIPLQGIILNKI